MTGEGIAQALETACSRRRAIAFVARRRTRRATAPTSTAPSAPTCGSRRCSSTCSRVPLGARAAIRAAVLTPWTRRNFARWMLEDYPRAVLFTPRRWHRKMFEPAGAYSPVDVPDGTGSLHSSHGDGAEAWPEAGTP